MSLHPTPVRLKLLREVAAGEVHRYGNGHDYDSRQWTVTSAVGLMARAGWVRLGEPGPLKTPWLLTETGAGVLAAEAMGEMR